MIKRFNPDFSMSISHELAYMRETTEGGYVAHGDYATLFSELEVVKGERDALERQLSMSEAKCKGYFSDAAAALVRCDALAVENAALKDTLGYICNRGNEPEYHDCGMGCGLEDRGITDRYEAMYHGWEGAMSRMYSDVIPEEMPETPATDSALAAIEERAKAEAFEEIIEFIDRRSGIAEMKTQWDLSSAIVAHIAELREAK
ncbi:hypothetical protein ACAY19_000817 [Serratia liquefaciens]